MAAVITKKIRDNDKLWFRKFRRGRKAVEEFQIANKSAIGIVLQNLSRKQQLGSSFTDDTKAQIFYRDAIKRAAICPICEGLFDPAKSVSYDHIQRVAEGGLGTAENGQMVHPYCNSGMKG